MFKRMFFSAAIILTGFAAQAQNNYVPLFDKTKFLYCDSCVTANDFKNAATGHFENNHASRENEFYNYTLVNPTANLAYFINLKHFYRVDVESGTTMNFIIPYALTGANDLNRHYSELLPYFNQQPRMTTNNIDMNGNLIGISSVNQKGGLSAYDTYAKQENFSISTESELGRTETFTYRYDIPMQNVGGENSLTKMGVLNTHLTRALSVAFGDSYQSIIGRITIQIKFPDGAALFSFDSISSAHNPNFSEYHLVYMEGTASLLNYDENNDTPAMCSKGGAVIECFSDSIAVAKIISGDHSHNGKPHSSAVLPRYSVPAGGATSTWIMNAQAGSGSGGVRACTKSGVDQPWVCKLI